MEDLFLTPGLFEVRGQICSLGTPSEDWYHIIRIVDDSYPAVDENAGDNRYQPPIENRVKPKAFPNCSEFGNRRESML